MLYIDMCPIFAVLPVLSQAPVKSEARARYIHIAWQQWSEMEDVGNRPIAFYKLQMRRAYPADSPWNFYGRTISHNGNLVASIMVENLDVDTEYYFRVITFRQEPSGPVAGPPSPVGGPFKTTCAGQYLLWIVFWVVPFKNTPLKHEHHIIGKKNESTITKEKKHNNRK